VSHQPKETDNMQNLDQNKPEEMSKPHPEPLRRAITVFTVFPIGLTVATIMMFGILGTTKQEWAAMFVLIGAALTAVSFFVLVVLYVTSCVIAVRMAKTRKCSCTLCNLSDTMEA